MSSWTRLTWPGILKAPKERISFWKRLRKTDSPHLSMKKRTPLDALRVNVTSIHFTFVHVSPGRIIRIIRRTLLFQQSRSRSMEPSQILLWFIKTIYIWSMYKFVSATLHAAQDWHRLSACLLPIMVPTMLNCKLSLHQCSLSIPGLPMVGGRSLFYPSGSEARPREAVSSHRF